MFQVTSRPWNPQDVRWKEQSILQFRSTSLQRWIVQGLKQGIFVWADYIRNNSVIASLSHRTQRRKKKKKKKVRL